MLAPLLCYVSHLVFLRNVCIRTQRAAVASRRYQLNHPPISLYTVLSASYNLLQIRIWYFTVVLGPDYFLRYVPYYMRYNTCLDSLLYDTNFLLLDIFRTVGPVLVEAIERYWQRVAARKSRGA